MFTAQNEKKKASLVAKCTKTGKIVGTRFGEIVTRETLKVEPKIYFLGKKFCPWMDISYLYEKNQAGFTIFCTGDMPKFVPVPEKLRKQAQIQKVLI